LSSSHKSSNTKKSSSSRQGSIGGFSDKKMGPSKMNEPHQQNLQQSLKQGVPEHRVRRGSLPELKTADKNAALAAEKKVPTGPKANPLYKTRLCMNYQSTGHCPYTDKCQFAHGIKELEKWENWRTSHKSSEETKKEDDITSSEGQRSRASSLEKPRTDSFDFGSPQSIDWEVSTPLKNSVDSLLDDTPVTSARLSDFSLWSSMLDDIENEFPMQRSQQRTRAATYDSTYDNISQLRDAPTLFPSPPVLPRLSKFNLSN
jgi:hypothetical protein